MSTTSPAFTVTSKRRKSFPSETRVKRGRRFVHGDVELTEKLGRNDLCLCGSGRRFQGLLHAVRPPRRCEPARLLSGSSAHLAAPPCLRLLERAGPDPAFGGARLALGVRIAAAAVARVVERMAGAHHGVAEIASVRRASRDLARVAVV